MTTKAEGTAACSEVLGSVCEGFSCRKRKGSGESTDQIPAVRLDGQEFILGDNGPYKTILNSTSSEFEIELDVIRGTVVQVDESPCSLENPLEEIMTWPKSEDGVQRGDVATPSREVERVGGAVLDQTSF
jgi:hypothetical protein